MSVIKKHKAGQSSLSIAQELKVGKTQVQSIIKDKEAILKSGMRGRVGTVVANKESVPTMILTNEYGTGSRRLGGD